MHETTVQVVDVYCMKYTIDIILRNKTYDDLFHFVMNKCVKIKSLDLWKLQMSVLKKHENTCQALVKNLRTSVAFMRAPDPWLHMG